MNPMMLKALVQKATETMESVKVAGRPSQHLEGFNHGYLGIDSIEYQTRLLTTLDREASKTSKIPRKCVLKRAGSSYERGNSVPLTEGSYFSYLKGTWGLLLNNFPNAQKEWPNEASGQLEVPQSVGRGPTFQNGGHCDPERSSEAGRLDGEGRSERCLLHHPNSPPSSAVSEIQSGKAILQLTCLPLGLSCATWTFTKVMKPLMTLLRSWGIRIIVYTSSTKTTK